MYIVCRQKSKILSLIFYKNTVATLFNFKASQEHGNEKRIYSKEDGQ